MPVPTRIGGKDTEELAVKTQEVDALDTDFRNLIQRIEGDENLEKYRQEYEKLYKTFKMSFDNEKKLVKQSKALNDMMMSNAASVKAALDMSTEDSNTIKRLRKEIEKAWQFVEKAKDKEEKSKKMVQDLKTEIIHLNKIVEQGAALSLGPENNVHDLIKSKEDLTKQNEEKKQLIETYEKETKKIKEEKAELETQVHSLTVELNTAKEDSDRFTMDIKRKDDKIVHQEEQQKNIQTDLDTKEGERKKIANLLDSCKQNCIDLSNENETKNRDLDRLKGEVKEEEKKLKEAINTKGITEDELQKYQNMKEQALEEEASLKSENSKKEEITKKTTMDKEKLKGAKKKLIEKIKDLESEKKSLFSTADKLERELERVQKEIDCEKQDYLKIKTDNEGAQHKVEFADKKNTQIAEELQNKENEKLTFQGELVKKQKDLEELRRKKDEVEKEKKKMFAKVASYLLTQQKLEAEVKLKDNLHTEIERKMMEYKEKAKEKERLYEMVRGDRNLYSKNLIEKHDEMNELKRKFDIITQQINQLKEELEAKDKTLVSKNHEFEKEKQEKEQNSIKVQKNEEEIAKLEKAKQAKDTDIAKLKAMIKDGEIEVNKLQKDYEKAIRDKDVYGTELIRRNDELTLLCEKIKILQSTLAKGEIQFKEKEAEIRLLLTKMAENKNSLTILLRKAGDVGKLKREIYTLTSSLVQERMQVQALSEELENPINVHRWRKLEGTDPDTYEMLQKIQALQKRLIKKTEEVVDREGKLQEKESQIQQLKQMLARQPGLETADSINVYQQNLKEKTKQMKAMAAELNMYQAQVYFNI